MREASTKSGPKYVDLLRNVAFPFISSLLPDRAFSFLLNALMRVTLAPLFQRYDPLIPRVKLFLEFAHYRQFPALVGLRGCNALGILHADRYCAGELGVAGNHEGRCYELSRANGGPIREPIPTL